MFSFKNFILKYGLFLFLLFLIVLIVLNFKVSMTFFFNLFFLNQSLMFQFLDNSIPYLETPDGVIKFKIWYHNNVDVTLRNAMSAQLREDMFKSKQQSFMFWMNVFNLGLLSSLWDPTGMSTVVTVFSLSKLADLTDFYAQNHSHLDTFNVIMAILNCCWFLGPPPYYLFDQVWPFMLHNGSIISYDLFFSQKSSLLEFITYAPSVHIEYFPNWTWSIDLVLEYNNSSPNPNPNLPDFSKIHMVEVQSPPLNMDPFSWYMYEVVKSWNMFPDPKPLTLPPAKV